MKIRLATAGVVLLLFGLLSGCVFYRDYDHRSDYGRPHYRSHQHDRHDHYDRDDYDRDRR